MLQALIDNAKIISGCVTAIGAVCGGYVYLDGPVPASRGYVIAQTQNVKRDLIEGRLETNDVRRQLLRKEKFDRTLDLEKVQEPNIRSLLRQRLDQVEDDLDSVEKARDELRKEKAQK